MFISVIDFDSIMLLTDIKLEQIIARS